MKCISYSKKLLLLLKVCFLGLLIGAFGGAVGAAFSHLLAVVTDFREGTPWILLLLPLGGMATVLLYRFFGLEKHRGTNEIIQCVKANSRVNPIAAPLIFISTAITHLFGGSAGREGAAIQLGGAGASAVCDVFRFKDETRTVLIMCGMGSVFAGVFGTPFTAAFFILEFKSSKKFFSLALIPCFVSAIIANEISKLLGVVGETAKINTISFSASVVGKILVLAIGLSVLGIVMCFVFEKGQEWAKKLISNSILRIILGAVAVIAMTAIVGDMRYNGSGMNMALSAIEGEASWFDFALKILFTAVTLAAGFKGGEIVPTFCIGATFGCVLGGILGLDVGFAAALGLVGLFCCVTNSLISAVFLGVEMFGLSAIPYFIIICIVLWLLSTKEGLFENRFFKSPIFTKIKR